MTEVERIEKTERLKDLIEMLKGDIENFGPSGDDLFRLKLYKKQLNDLQLTKEK